MTKVDPCMNQQQAAQTKRGLLPFIKKQLNTYLSPEFIPLNYCTLFWLFVVASIAGLALETIYHYIVFGGWESRAGLVWGPFSPIYGAGAVALTVLLNRFYFTHNIVVFLMAMVIGSTIEYVTSWGMEYFWHAVAWDYSGTFGSIEGRTNFLFGMMWGLLGLFWVRMALPVIRKAFKKMDTKTLSVRIVTAGVSLFILVNIVVTCAALDRESERLAGVPASNEIDHILDKEFPNSWLDQRFQNMTVNPKSTNAGLRF